ncbi:class A sortase [Lacticigenium naphthae]|uniref:class A sortase n=1 Tax=Lacticigenium naphthae TaxID=515351 RepID=UPI0004213515|nr:class A sortase [Lacticigenium naphthae]
MKFLKSRKLGIIIGSILILFGVLFLLAEPIQNAYVRHLSNQLTDEIGVVASDKDSASFDFSAVEEVTLEDLLQSQFNQSELPVVGSLAIPELGMHLAILEGVSNENLIAGAGTMKPDQEMGKGNFSLASHNMKDPTLLFAPLHQAKPGMKAYLTDKQHVYVYEIATHEIIEPTRVDVIRDTPSELLTMITCNYNGDMRLNTQGELIDSFPVSEAPEEIRAIFNLPIH